MIIYDDDGIGHNVVPMSVIEEIKDEIRNTFSAEYTATSNKVIVNRIISIIDKHISGGEKAANMERSSNGGWISVKDKLPEDFKDVLVWYEYFRYGDYNRMVQTYGIGCYISNLGAWSGDPGTGTMAKVIAWQPLPTPPESEG